MGRPIKKKIVNKTPATGRARASKYSRPLTKKEIEGIAFILSGGEKRVKAQEAREAKKKAIEAERKQKQEATKTRIKEGRIKKKPLTKKKIEGIKLTMRRVLRDIAKQEDRSRMSDFLFGSASKNFRIMVRDYPEQFKEVMKEPNMKETINQVLKRLGKRI